MNNNLENFLRHNKVFTNKDANQNGITNSSLTYYRKKGILYKYSKGIYISNYENSPSLDPLLEELLAILKKVKNGIVCLVTALYYYQLTDEMPKEYWIAIPNNKRVPKIKNTRFLRTRHYKLGLTKIKISNMDIPIYNREKTIIDSFKYLDIETALKSLKLYMKSHDTKPDINLLNEYGHILKKDISKYIIGINI